MTSPACFFLKGIMGLFLLISISLLLRVAVSLHSYSGAGTPPKLGDFDAQSQWMEITTNSPISYCYFNTTNNKLRYRGLDYPPLTATRATSWSFYQAFRPKVSLAVYFSWLCDAFWARKLLMRWTVLSSDLLIFSPAVLYFILVCNEVDKSDVVWHIPVILTNLCLILTDHDHFQYNCISLGLTLGAVAAVLSRKIF